MLVIHCLLVCLVKYCNNVVPYCYIYFIILHFIVVRTFNEIHPLNRESSIQYCIFMCRHSVAQQVSRTCSFFVSTMTKVSSLPPSLWEMLECHRVSCINCTVLFNVLLILWHLEPVDTGNPLSRINYIQEITSNLPASKTLICKQTNSESIPPCPGGSFYQTSAVQDSSPCPNHCRARCETTGDQPYGPGFLVTVPTLQS